MNAIGRTIGHGTLGVQSRTMEKPVSLTERLVGALESTKVQPSPEEPDPVREWACRMFYDEFLRAMITDNEEKLGPKPEPWDS